jgi:hypothetical protein
MMPAVGLAGVGWIGFGSTMKTSRLVLGIPCCLLAVATHGLDAETATVAEAVPRAQAAAGQIATDSPRGVVLRLEQAYQTRDLEGYAALMTADFRFRSFSPEFLERFPDGMTRVDERASARRLFHGDPDSPGQRGASIHLTLGRLEIKEDPLHPGREDRFRLVVAPSISLVVIDGGQRFEVIGTRHEYHVVRGNAAALEAGQRADADHWYVWKWDEYPPGVGRVADATRGEPASPALPELMLEPAGSPQQGGLSVRFMLAEAAPARLELFDVMGRRVRDRFVHGPAGVAQRIEIAAAGELPPGIYWARLTQNRQSLRERIVVAR